MEDIKYFTVKVEGAVGADKIKALRQLMAAVETKLIVERIRL